MPRQKIRVLQLVDSFTQGGAERIVMMLALHANREGFEVLPCALRRSGPLEAELQAAGVPYHMLGVPRHSVFTGPLFFADLMRTLGAVTQAVRELAIDIIHTHLTESTLIGVLAARRAGNVPVCATLHNIILHNTRGRLSPRQWLMQTAIDNVFSRADRIVAVSEEVAQAAQRHTRIPRERIVTIPNGVDPARFRYNGDRIVLRQTLNLPPERTVAVTVGRLTRQKGYPHLLAALALIPTEKRPVTLVVGDGPDRVALESQAAALGLADDVRFLGNRRDVPALLAAADLFVLSSLWEGLPLALLEAMAAGLPAVVTAVGGNVEVVEHGKSGILVPAADEQALAEVLSSVMHDPLQRERIGKAAREQFEQRYSLRSFIEAHERLYEELVSERPSHSAIAA